MKIKEALIEGRDYLKDLEYTYPIYETRRILSDLLNKDLSYLVSHDEDLLDSKIENKYFEILEKRQKGIPLQYILGEEDFYGRTFKVIEGVLIPRQDTEISVKKILNIIENNQINNMLEIGCGTGIVSISVDLESSVDVTAVDISEKAIENTKINKEKLNSKIKIIKSDLFSNINEKFDLIYSNPPYIKSKEIENLQVEVRDYEPRLALDGGEDGLFFYRSIIKSSPEFLNHKGFLVFEIGYDEAEDICNLMKDKFEVEVYKDLNNLDRVVVGQLKM
ncbi:MAG: peptide chain release factor N(5)-glutamine methyltransferase [Peptoniphilus harei]|uniref:Release factor glutamine methyltransferase n=1 Tax=Peptoniphilus harei ACS-146-V-Sch2b TaxID=908338 RepID=E4KYG9_9FIRM|nr:peptide chain release factor N(5)-glutamine methyltransferase [Peptoniphilus harei]EFR33048.1 protein-(glutamine-N5) methyltransferase, release factor-specific [Peptoniphilus harei ACS-146-V-Sch2b]MDK7755188.1 peptide chain release factor N(5)-glutamine methyltransferase [Peptoniphilus harei]MDK7760995.1 peptide chain release factor N(5)-glutamine methyltransferase [Peptoniphilus harei]MDK8270785.1 peptide chain release factor N(5)-glutamine methyltransferase [Peptoniphilus harei]MDK8339168